MRYVLILRERGNKKVQQVCEDGSRDRGDGTEEEEEKALKQTQFYAQMEGEA